MKQTNGGVGKRKCEDLKKYLKEEYICIYFYRPQNNRDPITMHCIYKYQEFDGTKMGVVRKKMHMRHFIFNKRYSCKYTENGSEIHLDFTSRENDMK